MSHSCDQQLEFCKYVIFPLRIVKRHDPSIALTLRRAIFKQPCQDLRTRKYIKLQRFMSVVERVQREWSAQIQGH